MSPGGLPIPVEVVLLAVVLAAAATDLRSQCIPNWITLPGAVLGFAIQGYYGGLHGVLAALAGGAMGFGFFFLLYLAGGMGAGDVKLAGAVGALVGPQAFVMVFIATGLLGGIAAIALSLAHGRLQETLSKTGGLLANLSLFRWRRAKQASVLSAPGALRLPYGAVIAGGALTYLALYH